MIKKTCILALFGAFSFVHASLLVEETFNYDDGTLGSTASNGTGVTGDWQLYSNNTGAATADIVTYNWLDGAGITNYGYSASNKALSGASGDAAAVALDGVSIDFDTAGVYYFSLLVHDVAGSNGGLIGFGNSSQNYWDIKMRMSQDVGAANTGYIGGTAVGNHFPGNGSDALMVGRLTTSATVDGNDVLDTFMVAEGGTLVLSGFGDNTGIINNNADVTGTANMLTAWNFQGNDNLIGDVRLGSTFDSVAIPEPTTFALLGIALGYLVYFRRRK